jgi:hypothetical protein
VESGPASYLTLQEGTPVLASGGERIGKVTHVLADPADDIFDGIVIDTTLGPGGHRFVDAPEVAEIRTDAVTLRLDESSCENLPEPSANPAAMAADPADDESPLHSKLRRAWDMVSGK